MIQKNRKLIKDKYHQKLYLLNQKQNTKNPSTRIISTKDQAKEIQKNKYRINENIKINCFNLSIKIIISHIINLNILIFFMLK